MYDKNMEPVGEGVREETNDPEQHLHSVML